MLLIFHSVAVGRINVDICLYIHGLLLVSSCSFSLVRLYSLLRLLLCIGKMNACLSMLTNFMYFFIFKRKSSSLSPNLRKWEALISFYIAMIQHTIWLMIAVNTFDKPMLFLSKQEIVSILLTGEQDAKNESIDNYRKVWIDFNLK